MKKILGIELGSTRIKAVLCDENGKVVASGIYEWENILVDGLWSYPLDQALEGLAESYAALAADYKSKFGEDLTELDALGISAMMHGYLAFDKDENLLAPFRTWRNTNTADASATLSEMLNFHIPMRWSVSQYYKSVTDKLPHVKDVAHLCTLAGYVHYRLSGERVLGMNDASGMFPIAGGDYDKDKLEIFNAHLASLGVTTKFETLLPRVLAAGECAGHLTEKGARLLDKSGKLRPGALMCPPEGDMGTGMIATCSVSPRTANVSSGTSVNLCVVLERPLKKYYPEVDIVETPDGHDVAMLHANNCTNEINEWVSLFSEVLSLFGTDVPRGELFTKLFQKSLESDERVGDVVGYNFLAGEPVAGTENGMLMTLRTPEGKLTLSNFMQMQIYSAIAALSLGMDILDGENVKISSVMAHGGFYKTDFVGQNATSALLGAPVTVMKTAGEGGAWGVALLALFALEKGRDLPAFLDRIFADTERSTVAASDAEKAKIERYMALYRSGLKAEKIASEDVHA